MRLRIIAAAIAGVLVTGFAAPALANMDGWQVRARAIGVIPDESASFTPSGSVSVDDAWMPELDFTYFASENISFELILATTEHDVSANVTGLGNVDLGSVWVLPPTLTAQYRFNPQSQFQPYVGVGINYTIFYGEDEPAGINMSYDDSFGFALQGGVDIMIDEHWLFNIDVKKIWLSTDVNVNAGLVTGNVDLDPWVVGVGFGYRY